MEDLGKIREREKRATKQSMEEVNTKTFLLYFLSISSLAVVSVFFLPDPTPYRPNFANELLHLFSPVQVWPELDISWKSGIATVVGFLGSAFGTVGGVGGGGIFVPMLNLVVGFDTKSAAALSKCMIMGASISSVWYNVRVRHPTKDVPIIDYDLALLFQPMLMLGITIGVSLSVVFPYWLITVLIIILFLATSSRSFYRGLSMWRQETYLKRELLKKEQSVRNGHCNGDEAAVESLTDPLLPRHELTKFEILCLNIKWRGILVLMIVWICFLSLQIIKNSSNTCGTTYWILNLLQFPVAMIEFAWEAVKLYRESNKLRLMNGDSDSKSYVCEATIEWTPMQLIFCAACGLLGGTVGGLLGSGGGFILGPLLLEIGVIPQVASATATFVMMFSSSLSVVEFYYLNRFPLTYAIYLIVVSMLAGFWGQYVVRKIVTYLKRASIIVFILSSVIFASALTMGVIGIESSIRMIKNHEYMGFLSFCDNQ